MNLHIRLKLVVGTTEHSLSLEELALTLRQDLSSLRGVLFALVRDATRGIGLPDVSRTLQEAPTFERNEDNNYRSYRSELEATQQVEEAAVDNTDAFATYLAERLNDRRSLAFYKLVVRTLPRAAVEEALRSTLDVPLQDVRRSRGALFTSIVRPFMKSRGQSPHQPV